MKAGALLKEGIFIIALEDFTVPGTGLTFYYYRGNKYKITNYLPIWYEKHGQHAWRIELIDGKGDPEDWKTSGYFSEEDLMKKFNCIKYQRKEKLKKINEKTNSAN